MLRRSAQIVFFATGCWTRHTAARRHVMNVWTKVFAASAVKDRTVGCSWCAAPWADSDNWLTVTTPKSWADSTGLTWVDRTWTLQVLTCLTFWTEPSQMMCVLVGLRRSLPDRIGLQALMLLTHAVKCKSVYGNGSVTDGDSDMKTIIGVLM